MLLNTGKIQRYLTVCNYRSVPTVLTSTVNESFTMIPRKSLAGSTSVVGPLINEVRGP